MWAYTRKKMESFQPYAIIMKSKQWSMHDSGVKTVLGMAE